MKNLTLVVPYYRSPGMLAYHCREWARYPSSVHVIVIDDGSPEEPALPVLEGFDRSAWKPRVHCYRVTVDIPWNREGARNLGTYLAETDWLVHLDIDHVLSANAVRALLEFEPRPSRWYRFPRWRVGMADETRRKDSLPDDCELGRIKPHIDSYLMSRATYFEVGGYDEDFAGSLGGGTHFLRRATRTAGEPDLLPDHIPLLVHTRHVVPDASERTLSRDTTRGKQLSRSKEKLGDPKPGNLIRFPWIREL